MENRLKEEFLSMEIPEMKEDIMKAVKKEKSTRTREGRRLKPAAVIVMAAMIALLAVTAGAVAGEMLKLNRGGKILLNVNGVVVSPTGFHLEGDVNVPLSEKALENIRPYVASAKPGEVSRDFETDDLSVMEEFIDMPLVLPRSLADEANLYRLWASGTDGEAVAIHVQIGTPDDVDVMMVYLRSFPRVVGTASEPDMEQAYLPDGTPVSIAVAERTKGGLVAHALYRKNEAVYHLTLTGESKKTLLADVQAVLDTVK